jgi:hypothetical protein
VGDVTCVRCRAPIAPGDINVQQAIAKCAACGAVFDFTAQVREGARPLQRVRPQVAMPRGWVVDETPPARADGDPYREAAVSRGSLTITWRWQHAVGIGFLLFALVWWAFLVFWVAFAPGLMKLFATLHGAAGVVIVYVGLAMITNRTTVRVHGDVLEVDHRPLWWPGRLRMGVADIDQLYVVQRLRQRSNNQGPRTTYELCALDRRGTQRKVMTLDEADQALYLEQRIEHHLGIVDVEVAGSVTA